MPIIPVIIPFYKEHEKLRKCQAAIAAQSQPGCEAFVRDNTHDNILYTAAVNEGLAKYCYRDDVRYVLVLNQDAYMHKDCVRHLVDYMDAHPECGIACPIQYAQTKPASRWGALGDALSFEETRVVTWGGSLQAFPFGVHGTDAIGSYKEPFETYWANGACMMIRAETVRECGRFDRNMRFICSDSDFSFTVRARGWQVSVVPKALCEHSLGASGATPNLDIQLVKARDAVYFADKWLSGGLYRQLALEGPGLAGADVRQWLARLRYQALKLERGLGRAPGGDAALYSFLMTMRMPEKPEGPGFRL